jgi:hypothetical protein
MYVDNQPDKLKHDHNVPGHKDLHCNPQMREQPCLLPLFFGGDLNQRGETAARGANITRLVNCRLPLPVFSAVCPLLLKPHHDYVIAFAMYSGIGLLMAV